MFKAVTARQGLLFGSTDDPLHAACPLVEVRMRKDTRNGFDWKVIEGLVGGEIVIRADRHFWSQARLDFSREYDIYADSIGR